MTAVLLAAYLHVANVHLVQAVLDAGGLDAVALVWCESRFNEHAVRREPRGHTSWGLYQLDDEFHPQWRHDLLRHIAEGQLFLDECKLRAETADGRNARAHWYRMTASRPSFFAYAVALYNGSLAWGFVVERERDELARWLWNHEQIAGGKV